MITRLFLLIELFLLTAAVGCCSGRSEIFYDQDSYEQRALIYLIHILKSRSYQDDDVIMPLEFEDDFKKFELADIYANKYLCLISDPQGIIEYESVGYYRQLSDSLRAAHDRLELSGYIPSELEHPKFVNTSSYLDYCKLKNSNSYLFTVRHHIKYNDITLVQIHVVPFEKLNNPFEYTFYIYFDNEELVDWNIELIRDFEFELDCENMP